MDTDTLECEICGKQFKNTNYLKVSIPLILIICQRHMRLGHANLSNSKKMQ